MGWRNAEVRQRGEKRIGYRLEFTNLIHTQCWGSQFSWFRVFPVNKAEQSGSICVVSGIRHLS